MKPSDFLTELSTEKLAQYKTAAAADASKADKEKDFARGDKRFSGIVKATKKQFDNDAKKGVSESDLDRFKKYTRPVVKTTPKIEKNSNPAGRSGDHNEWKVTTPTGEIYRYKSKKEAQAHYDSFSKKGVAEGSAANDYFTRRKSEEDRIAGVKAPAKNKKNPANTDYAKKRKQQDVTEVESTVAENYEAFKKGIASSRAEHIKLYHELVALRAKKDAAKKDAAKKEEPKKQGVAEGDTLMNKLHQALLQEGRVKELADDLKTLSDAEFIKKYGKAKAAIRRDMKKLDEQGVAEDKDPCWDGYKQIGMKKKSGKQVPNCVPVKESAILKGLRG
jgi:hypothetical protein